MQCLNLMPFDTNNQRKKFLYTARQTGKATINTWLSSTITSWQRAHRRQQLITHGIRLSRLLSVVQRNSSLTNSPSTNKKPWISRETVRQIRQRNRAYQIQRRTRNQHDQDRYRDLKHKTQKKIRKDFWKYLEDIVTPSEGNNNTRAANKKFRSFVKHTRQDSVGIPNLTDTQGDEHTTPQGKAQALNQHFASVFSGIKPSSLKDMTSLLIRPMYPYMRPLCFKTAGISKLVCGLDNNKDPGPDGIHPRILRQLNLAIAPILQVIFEKTYREGVVPDDWRRAHICPIYKQKAQERTQPITYQYPLHVLLVNYLST